MAMPADPNDGSLLSSVFLSSDDTAYAAACDLWKMTGLPEPQYGDYYTGMHADRVFLNSHGLCLSFVYRRSNLFSYFSSGIPAPIFAGRRLVDDRILQPLLQVDLSPNCCFEIVPGVEKIGVDKTIVRSIARGLKEKQIAFFAPEQEFVGQVRRAGAEDPFYVIVNRRSVKPVSRDALTRSPADTELQDSVYGGLRERFATAWNEGSGAAFEAATQECARIAALAPEDENKILHDHWNGAGPQSHRRTQIVQAAQSYARTLTVP